MKNSFIKNRQKIIDLKKCSLLPKITGVVLTPKFRSFKKRQRTKMKMLT